ncbi:hypothetical protein BH11BAC6_BH11BAC6_09420 [soil metagenome]
MKLSLIVLPVLAVCMFACRKEQSKTQTAFISSENMNIPLDADTEKIPLTDLGTGTYFGYAGGLYPNGENEPSGDYAQDLFEFSSAIVPLDGNGNYAPTTGKIGFISIGASTCSIMMNNLRKKIKQSPLTNPRLLMANCTGGGESVQEINDTISNAYWRTVDRKLGQNSLLAKQVEVVYMETDDSIRNMIFPARPINTKNQYAVTMQLLLKKFQNLKVVYLIGRTTTFLASGKKPQNREPGPYYNGWACKFLIEDQINGNIATAYKGPDAVSPMITWGWYEWSVGYQPRNDGFVWTRELTSDGLHANDQGADILSTNFFNFLLNDPFANIWFAKH